MRFDEDTRLDTSQVQDTRRSRLPGGGVAIGDDRLQKRFQGQVDPESWTEA